jgi:hypothetical protein
MKTVTSYRLENGKITKTEHSRSSYREYLSESEDLPFHQTVLNAYKQVESEGKLNHLPDKLKTRIRDIHSQVLEYGDYKSLPSGREIRVPKGGHNP